VRLNRHGWHRTRRCELATQGQCGSASASLGGCERNPGQPGRPKTNCRCASPAKALQRPVTIRFVGEMEGVSPQEFTIPPDVSRKKNAHGTGRLRAARATFRCSRRSAVRADAQNSRLDRGQAPPAGSAGRQWSWWLVIVIGMWTAILAGGLSLALVVGQKKLVHLSRPLILGQLGLLAAGSCWRASSTAAWVKLFTAG